MTRHTRWFGLLALAAILMLALPLNAQDDDSSPTLTLTLSSRDALFQPLAPGDTPVSANFTRELETSADTDQPVIYVAIQNTGWSSGTLTLTSDALDPETDYVALEVDAEGAPVEGSLAFELAYNAEAEAFELTVLIAQTRTLVIFAQDADGTALTLFTNTDDGGVTQQTLEITIAPEPVFGPLVLECHIIALPDIPTLEPDATAESVNGEWGACGSCATCGHAGECMLSPEGECVWNPSDCGGGITGDDAGEDDEPSGPSGGDISGGDGGDSGGDEPPPFEDDG